MDVISLVDLKLISLVKKHTVLYDYKWADHRNRSDQENAWQTIAASMEENDVINIKNRWKYLSQRYLKEKAKEALSTDIYKEDPWKYMKYLQFLEPVLLPEINISNVCSDKKTETTAEDNIKESNLDDIPTSPTLIVESFPDSIESPNQELNLSVTPQKRKRTDSIKELDLDEVPTCPTLIVESFPDSIESPHQESNLSVTPQKRKRTYSTDSSEYDEELKSMSMYNEILKDIVNTLDRIARAANKDGDECFGRFVAACLADMPEEIAKKKMLEITKLLLGCKNE